MINKGCSMVSDPGWPSLREKSPNTDQKKTPYLDTFHVVLAIIYSKECTRQNSKYFLVRRGISSLIVFADLFLNISLYLDCKFILISPRR